MYWEEKFEFIGRNIRENDYISLTDIAKYKSEELNDVIRNWMRGKDTIEFLGLWETLNNPNFNASNSMGLKCQLRRVIGIS